MNDNWVGKVVSIKCVDKLGIFQGTITEVTLTTIKIGNAFRNGLPMKSDVVINASDISQLDVIAAFTLDEIEMNNSNNTNNSHNTNNNNNNNNNINNHNNSESNGKIIRTNNADDCNARINKQEAESINNSSGLSNRIKHMKINMKGNTNVNSSSNTSNQREHQQHQPPPPPPPQQNQVSVTKSEIRLATSAPTSSFMTMQMMMINNKNTSSNPIEIQSQKITSNNNHNNGNNNGNNNHNQNNNNNNNNNNGMPSLSLMRSSDKKKNYSRRNAYANNQAFATSCEDPTLDEDFDFEKNLALFDKQAIWEEIDSAHKPDLVRQTPSQRNYRHDENILASNPTRYRQITTEQTSDEYTTDDGLVIPSISASLRYLLQSEAESQGLIWSRQCDMLARGTTEIAISILGGARRLIPKNQHQWPTIVIICDRPDSDRQSEVGLNTGRILSSHGLKTYVVVKTTTVKTNSNSNELQLYKATGNAVIQNPMTELPSSPDLIILSISGHSLRDDINTWITDIRSPIIAVDPPVVGIKNIQLKLSILPILPLDGMNKACGKLYLCNLGIPDLYFQNAGIKYKSPFGHKFVIPLHDM